MGTGDSEPSATDLQAQPQGLPFEIGSLIAGKYRVDRVLGAGGMGVIFAGHHTALDQRVAIKILKPNAIDNAEFVTRFGREARAAARLKSEHVARVLDVGETEKGLPYMVMEYLSGKDLSRIVREKGPLAVQDACEYVLQACEALAEAHAAGIIHRDLKPANLFLTKGTDGTDLVKVLDFGISKIVSPSGDDGPSEGLTQTQAMIGSPHYMSPEQLKSARDVDSRTDIWSLGGVLFKLLTNQPAFEGSSTPELCVAILVGPLRSMREIRPDIPADLEAIVAKCLSKDANERFATVSDLARALSRFAPAGTRSSVERIARVTSNPHLRFQGSDPPPQPRKPTASRPNVPGAENATLAVKHEMTTLTASAASMPADAKPSVSVNLPLESRKKTWIFAAAGVAVLGVAITGAALTLGRHGVTPGAGMVASAPPPETSASVAAPTIARTADPPPTIEPPAAATASATPSTETSASPTSPTTKGAKPVVGLAPKIGKPVAPAVTASAAPKPTVTVPAPPAPSTPTATTGMPEFGGRK